MSRQYTRKDFIRLSGGAVAGVAAAPLLGAAPAAALGESQEEPDLIVVNAKVWTVDPRHGRAQAFAVKGDRFTAVGSNDRIRNLAGRRTQRYDAQGMAIVPGMIDCHNHASGAQVLFNVLVGNPFTIEFVTVASIVDKLRARAQSTPAGSWVDGFFLDDTKISDGPLTKEHLDQASTTNPIQVHHRGGHTSWFNNKAFELAGVTKDTPNPPGGTFVRDANGNLTGEVTDNAVAAFDNIAPRVPLPPNATQDGLAFISQKFVEFGLTSVTMENPDLDALRQVRDDGKLLHRANYQPGSGIIDDAIIKQGIRTGDGDEWIRFGANSELIVDGSFSERTMALSIPYPGSNPPYFGNVTVTQDDLNDFVEHMMRNGIQPNLHVNGDVAIDMGLTAIERAQSVVRKPLHGCRPDGQPCTPRPQLTHCTLMRDSFVDRIKAVGGVPQAFTTYAYYNADKFHFYGEELMRNAMAFRTFEDNGIPAAAGSDFGPGPFDPIMAFQGMTTRVGWNGETWGANQRVSLDEAIKVYTLNGAHTTFEESIKGSITPGKLADFVVLAEDPHDVPPDQIINKVKVVRTVVGGQVKFAA